MIEQGGGGHIINTASMAGLLAPGLVAGYAASGQDPPTFGDDRGEAAKHPLEIRPGLRNPVIEPCKDGHVAMTFVLGAQGNHGFGQAMRWAAEEEALDADLRERDWSTWLDDLANESLSVDDAIRGLGQLLDLLKTKTKAEIQAEAVARKMLIAPAYTPADLYADPQLAARDYWVDVAGLRHPGPFAKLSRTPTRVRGAAASLGQHTDEILPELGIEVVWLDRLGRHQFGPKVLYLPDPEPSVPMMAVITFHPAGRATGSFSEE